MAAVLHITLPPITLTAPSHATRFSVAAMCLHVCMFMGVKARGTAYVCVHNHTCVCVCVFDSRAPFLASTHHAESLMRPPGIRPERVVLQKCSRSNSISKLLAFKAALPLKCHRW